METKQLVSEIVKILDSKKASDIKVLNIDGISVLTDYFIIASGNSTTQVKAIADEIDYKLSQQNILPSHKEGVDGALWILLDYGNVVVHVFHHESRMFYSLERLWSDAKTCDIDEILNLEDK